VLQQEEQEGQEVLQEQQGVLALAMVGWQVEAIQDTQGLVKNALAVRVNSVAEKGSERPKDRK
ncbi:hypothetical protein FQN60_000657, partial [Etheostoma spectabile]